MTIEMDDDGFTCDCHSRKGWEGKPAVPVNGENWPLSVAAKIIGCPEKDIRELVRILKVEPAGTLRMASYRRSGRNPRAYDGSKLVIMWDDIQKLAEKLRDS